MEQERLEEIYRIGGNVGRGAGMVLTIAGLVSFDAPTILTGLSSAYIGNSFYRTAQESEKIRVLKNIEDKLRKD